jgi:hypothetical protein
MALRANHLGMGREWNFCSTLAMIHRFGQPSVWPTCQVLSPFSGWMGLNEEGFRNRYSSVTSAVRCWTPNNVSDHLSFARSSVVVGCVAEFDTVMRPAVGKSVALNPQEGT